MKPIAEVLMTMATTAVITVFIMTMPSCNQRNATWTNDFVHEQNRKAMQIVAQPITVTTGTNVLEFGYRKDGVVVVRKYKAPDYIFIPVGVQGPPTMPMKLRNGSTNGVATTNAPAVKKHWWSRKAE